jgi:hypothetical protein
MERVNVFAKQEYGMEFMEMLESSSNCGTVRAPAW